MGCKIIGLSLSLSLFLSKSILKGKIFVRIKERFELQKVNNNGDFDFIWIMMYRIRVSAVYMYKERWPLDHRPTVDIFILPVTQ